eukprot:CAMPEP_0170482252 /NCGR_PEP_ID=MMETSP0208-20121228/2352_1 /TAXON_ID=197538 /ORGANISM="Strombidium inclinatum, Strain S3" /LENGTH=67 /DNA_ID=CAMNT_0010755071 /DNA_START=340 /DNA_END=543 /DNA_ORIENTATION=-
MDNSYSTLLNGMSTSLNMSSMKCGPPPQMGNSQRQGPSSRGGTPMGGHMSMAGSNLGGMVGGGQLSG